MLKLQDDKTNTTTHEMTGKRAGSGNLNSGISGFSA